MISMEPIGWVRSARRVPSDDFWGGTKATIVLAEAMGESAFDGIEEFSHAEIVYYFDKVDPEKVVRTGRRPRGNPDWPSVGIFAQRGKDRPNRIGATIVRILGRAGRTLEVAELDSLDGTPVLDVKPVMREFLPREPVRQPFWATELMRDYWATKE
jgi:tRNA-Thr(GGU) m(6)t(6)A37 methyltransferase TsaA